MSMMHIFAAVLKHPWTSLSYVPNFVESRVPPRLLFTRYCQLTGRRKTFRPSSLTKCFIWAMPSDPGSTALDTVQPPEVSVPKSSPAILMPAYWTLATAEPAAAAKAKIDVFMLTYKRAYRRLKRIEWRKEGSLDEQENVSSWMAKRTNVTATR